MKSRVTLALGLLSFNGRFSEYRPSPFNRLNLCGREHSDYVELALAPSALSGIFAKHIRRMPPNATIVLSNFGESTSPHFRLTSFCEMKMGGLRGAGT